ncbi:hypothetical protein B5X24_HaOG210083 [Helicoverpa armigera]|nr:hypothetical protein B5X24_HaOG210083 [Helicoverpa armigera]
MKIFGIIVAIAAIVFAAVSGQGPPEPPSGSPPGPPPSSKYLLHITFYYKILVAHQVEFSVCKNMHICLCICKLGSAQ